MAKAERLTGAIGMVGMALAILGGSAARASAENASPVASPWLSEQASRVRVVAGSALSDGGKGARIYAGLEIELDDGWKTYWRNPGSSGVPPRVDLEGSQNLARAELLFPAPLRFKDRDGDTIGYKKHVVLPVALTPIDPSKPIILKVAAEFGVCREICIPVQSALALTVPPGAAPLPADDPLQKALQRVPLESAPAHNAPRIERIRAELTGDKPKLVIDARFPDDRAAGDVFLEAPDGLWLPLPQPGGEVGKGVRRFIVDLTDGVDLDDLKGRRIRATLVGASSQSEATFDLVEAN